MVSDLFVMGRELYLLVDKNREGGFTTGRVALAVAEEVGETIGAYNKFMDGKTTNLAHFRQEWAQATLMLSILGLRCASPQQLNNALEDEMQRQHERWNHGPA